MAKEAFNKALNAVGSGKRFPVISLVKNDPAMAALVSKLITPVIKPQYDNAGSREFEQPNLGLFKTLSDHKSQDIADGQTVMQTLPDMELSAQILVASILSPKDMMTTELTYSVNEGLMAPDISAAMISATKTYFEQDYKIKPLLPKMLRDILFETGSYAVAVIPENSVDEIINGQSKITLESLRETINSDGSIKSLGILGPINKTEPNVERRFGGLSLESFNKFISNKNVDGRITLEGSFNGKPVETFLTVTDNPNLLKIPRINQKIRESRIVEAIGSRAMEALGTRLSDREMTGKIFKEKQFGFKPISSLKTQEQLNRATIGNPLVLHLPSESVIPVHVPGCIEEQVGFFVLIDADGNPVSRNEDIDHYSQLSSRLNSNGSFPSAMLSKVKSMMSGFDMNNSNHLDYGARAYGAMVEQDLLARLRNGVYGNGVALAKREEVYRIMFARALAKQHTQLLFIPIELMSYMAFRYNSNGIGKSLLDDMKILNSLRSMLLFSNVMASIKNSIGRTNVKLKLDENDPNPQKTIEIAMHEIIRSRQQAFPLGMNSPTDLVDWLQRSGYEFSFEGHPGLPDINIDFTEKNSSYAKPDTELEDNLRKRAIMSTGLNPETVDASFNTEFATSVVQNNIMLSKRVIQIQEVFTPQLSGHMRKCMLNSEGLINELRSILENNFDKLKLDSLDKDSDETELKTDDEKSKRLIISKFLHEYIMSFEVTLPKPNSVTLENQVTALETYTKALDATLEAWVSEKFFTSDIGGDIANQVATVKEVLKAYYLRQWMAENGVMTELSNLTTTGPDGEPLVDIYKMQAEHISALSLSLTKFMAILQPTKDASNDVTSNFTEGSGGSSMDTSSSDDSGEDDGFGGDDFGMDDEDAEADTEETPETEEAPEEEKKDESLNSGLDEEEKKEEKDENVK